MVWSCLNFQSELVWRQQKDLTGENFLVFFFLINFYWRIVALQYCVHFYCIAKWISHMYTHAWVHAPLLQSYLTLCDPMDCSPPGSSVHGILQARILESVVILFSTRLSWPRDHTRVNLESPALEGGFFTHWATWEAHVYVCNLFFGELSSLDFALDSSAGPLASFLP